MCVLILYIPMKSRCEGTHASTLRKTAAQGSEDSAGKEWLQQAMERWRLRVDDYVRLMK